MDSQDSRKILERFFELLMKQADGGEGASALPVFEPGEEIVLRVDSVKAPRKRSAFDNVAQLPVELDEESEIRLVALLYHMDFKDEGLNIHMKDFWEGGINPSYGSSLSHESYGTALSEYLMRQQLAHVEPERIVAILGELREPEAVSALLDLLREVDPERAKAVEAALPPSPEAMQAEIESLRRQVSELAAERDALLKAQLP